MRNRTGQTHGFRAKPSVNLSPGFTLIEMLIVIAILLALGGLLLLNFLPAKESADAKLQQLQFARIDEALMRFKVDMKRWPNEDEGLIVLMSKDAITDENDATTWHGPYLDAGLAKDQWKHDIVYRIPSEELGEGAYDLISLGPDGQEGTGDDITNHDKLRNAQGEIEGAAGASADETAPPPIKGG